MIIPVTLIINAVIFGGSYFTDWKKFLFASAVTAAVFCIDFVICGWVAVMMKKRFPAPGQLSVRLTLMILSFILLTGLFFFALFRGYENFPFLHYSFNEPGFIWAYIGMSIINVFITLLMEGIARFESWKQNMQETEQLKKTFRQSQLQGLKSQVNPHFLFNSLNVLSSLVHRDADLAEKFIRQLSDVYRYILDSRGKESVPIPEELETLRAYLFLMDIRFGTALHTNISIPDQAQGYIAPLTLQMLVENALKHNEISKANPLNIDIFIENNDWIVVRNNL